MRDEQLYTFWTSEWSGFISKQHLSWIQGVFIAAIIRIIEVFFWPICMSLLQFNFLLVYSHLFNFDCKYIKTIYVNCSERKKLENDLHSNEHYLNCSENKTWKKFRLVRDLNPWHLRYWCSALSTELTSHVAIHRYHFYKFTVIYSSLHGFIWNQHNDQHPVGIHDS